MEEVGGFSGDIQLIQARAFDAEDVGETIAGVVFLSHDVDGTSDMVIFGHCWFILRPFVAGASKVRRPSDRCLVDEFLKDGEGVPFLPCRCQSVVVPVGLM